MQGSRSDSIVAAPQDVRPTQSAVPVGERSVTRRGGPARGGIGKIPRIYAQMFMAAIVLTVGYHLVFNPGEIPVPVMVLASTVFCLGSAPLYFFLRNADNYQIPCFETHAFFYAICFGFAGYHLPSSLPETITVNWQDMLDSLFYSFWGLIALIAGYHLSAKLVKKRLTPARLLPLNNTRYIIQVAILFCVVGFFFEFINLFLHTAMLVQVPNLVFTFGFLTLFVLALEKKLNHLTCNIFLFVVAPAVMIWRSGLLTGQLAGSMLILLAVCVGTLRTRRRIPVGLFTAVVALLLILQPVKFYVRNLIWTEEMHLNPLEVVEAYVEGFTEVYGSPEELFANGTDIFQTSFDRVNHLVTTAAIVHDTPSKQPFTHGSTYVPLLTKWIPRFLWKDKPEERTGNEWASRYGYLYERDSTTSFNLPWLPEMYMNFGPIGVVATMFTLGVMFRILWRLWMQRPATAADCAVAIVLAQSLVFPESNLSLMLGGPIIFGFVLLGLRIFTGLSASRA